MQYRRFSRPLPPPVVQVGDSSGRSQCRCRFGRKSSKLPRQFGDECCRRQDQIGSASSRMPQSRQAVLEPHDFPAAVPVQLMMPAWRQPKNAEQRSGQRVADSARLPGAACPEDAPIARGLSVKAGKAQLFIGLVLVGYGVTVARQGPIRPVREETYSTAWFGVDARPAVDQRHGLCDGTNGVDMMRPSGLDPNLLDLRLISGRDRRDSSPTVIR